MHDSILVKRPLGVALSSGVVALAVAVLAPVLGWAAATEKWRLFALTGSIALLPIFLRWPVVSTFGVYAFVLPFEAVLMSGGATVARFAGLLAAAALVLVGLHQRRLARLPSGALWWLALVIWAGMTLGWALDLDIAAVRFRSIVNLLALFLVAVSFRVSRDEINGICVLTVLGGIAAAVIGYALGMDAFDAGRRGTLVIGSASANQNGFAASMLQPIALAAVAFLKLRGGAARGACLGAIVLLAGGVYMSISRAAILALVVILGVLVYRSGLRWHVFLVVGVPGGLLAVMPDHFFNRVMSPFTGADPTGSGRTEIWSIGLRALEDFWLWGAGVSNFPVAYARYTAIPPGDIAMGAHNSYLGTWVELGVVGLFLMLLAIWSVLRIAWRHRHSGSPILYATEATFIGVLVLSLFGDGLWAKRLWLLATMVMWEARLLTESKRTSASAENPAITTVPDAVLAAHGVTER